MRTILFFFFATLVCAFGSRQVPRLDGRIVGGSPVSIDKYPYQVSLQMSKSHICGASIISPNWILCAAHCVVEGSVNSFTVRAGTSTRNSGGITKNVKNIFYHAYYDDVTFDYDISVIELSSTLSYTTAIQPVQLPSGNQNINTGTVVTITGWGRTSSGGPLPSQLLAVQVPIISKTVCTTNYALRGYTVTDRMICAGNLEGGQDSCQGDSGGPLALNNVQWGIVSWGYGCAVRDLPGVYSNVANLRSWITQVTGV